MFELSVGERIFTPRWDLLRCRDILVSLILEMGDLSAEKHLFDWQSQNIHQISVTTEVGLLMELICFPIFTPV